MGSLKDLLAKKAAEANGNSELRATPQSDTAIQNGTTEVTGVENKPNKGFRLGIKLSGGGGNEVKKDDASGKQSTSITGVKPSQSVGAASQPASTGNEDFNHPKMVEKFELGDVNAFKEAVGILHKSIEFPDLVGNATINILLSLKENPDFVKILAPQDYQAMIRALRESHGITVSSKVANKTKRASRQKDVDDLGAMIGDIDLT